MIESLRRSESRFLALFAVCTFGLGFVVGIMVRLFYGKSTAVPGGVRLQAFDRSALEMGAAVMSSNVAVVSLVFWILSFGVLAVALMNTGPGSDDGLVRVMARTLYVASVIAMVAAISSATAFMMVHS